MDARTAQRLYASMELHGQIMVYARRYFSVREDREDAKQEAWAAIVMNGCRACTVREAEGIARRCIRNKYMRVWRARQHIQN